MTILKQVNRISGANSKLKRASVLFLLLFIGCRPFVERSVPATDVPVASTSVLPSIVPSIFSTAIPSATSPTLTVLPHATPSIVSSIFSTAIPSATSLTLTVLPHTTPSIVPSIFSTITPRAVLPSPTVTPNAVNVSPDTLKPSEGWVLNTSFWDRAACRDSVDEFLREGKILPLSPSHPIQAPPSQYSPPPPVGRLEEVGAFSTLDTYALGAARYLEEHPEDLDGLQTWLKSQGVLCKVKEGAWACPRGVMAYNLDNDPALEYIVTISLPYDASYDYCGTIGHTQITYILNCQTSPAYCEVYRARRKNFFTDGGGCINGVADINNDGKSEVAITYHLCGASDCWNTLEIVQAAEGYGYRFLMPTLRVKGCFVLQDVDGDGSREILATNTELPGYVGGLYTIDGKPRFGPRPSYLLVYSWNGEQYVLVDRWYRKHSCQFGYVWEAVERVRMGQIGRALSVLQQMTENPDISERCGGEGMGGKAFPWKAYAEYAVGVLNARLGRRDAALEALGQVENFDAENIFTPLAQIFSKVYQGEGYDGACRALTAYVSTLPDDAPFYGPFPESRLITMCPEDLK